MWFGFLRFHSSPRLPPVTKRRKPIRLWRVSQAEPRGLHVWFDPDTEVLKLYALEPQPKVGVGEDLEGDDRDAPGRPDQVNDQLVLDDELPF